MERAEQSRKWPEYFGEDIKRDLDQFRTPEAFLAEIRTKLEKIKTSPPSHVEKDIIDALDIDEIISYLEQKKPPKKYLGSFTQNAPQGKMYILAIANRILSDPTPTYDELALYVAKRGLVSYNVVYGLARNHLPVILEKLCHKPEKRQRKE